MDLYAGMPWRGLSLALIPSVRADVAQRVLGAANQRTADELVAWAAAATAEEYQPGGFDRAAAAAIVTGRPFPDLVALAELDGLALAELGDLVYAGAAEGALDPARVRVEEVYELSVLGGVAAVSSLRVPIPQPGADISISVGAARADVLGQAEITALRPAVRQRRQPDAWAELELDAPARIWSLSVSQRLFAHVADAGVLMLFPQVGAEFADRPVLVLTPAGASTELPGGGGTEDHLYFMFPEIEGERFLLRLHAPALDAPDNDPGAGAEPGGDIEYFLAEDGDVLLYGPSLPSDIDLRLDGAAGWQRRGTLDGADRSPDLAESMQRAVDALMQARTVAAGAGRELAMTATSRTLGKVHLGLNADLHLETTAFADGGRARTLVFDSRLQTGEVVLPLPAAGEPARAGVDIAGELATSVVMRELGRAVPAAGIDAMGVRLVEGVSYTQRLTVEVPFAATAVDLRLASVLAGTEVVVVLISEDGAVRGSRSLAACGREPLWYRVALDAPLAVEPDTSYRVRVSVAGGQVTWLCGTGSQVSHLRRDDGRAPVQEVRDVTDGGLVAGRLRLRADRPVDDPRLDAVLLPGNVSVPIEDVHILDDGSFRARANLLPVLGQMGAGPVTLRMQARSEGTVRLESPHITYKLHIEAR